MSAVEIIEKFKSLPAGERDEVREFVLKFEVEEKRKEEEMTLEKARELVFKKHDRLLSELAK